MDRRAGPGGKTPSGNKQQDKEFYCWALQAHKRTLTRNRKRQCTASLSEGLQNLV